MSTIDAILGGTDALALYIREIGEQMNGVNAGAPIVSAKQADKRRTVIFFTISNLI